MSLAPQIFVSYPQLSGHALTATMLGLLIAGAVCSTVVRCDDDLQVAESVTETIAPFLKSYCLDCYNTEQAEAKLDLSGFKTASDIAAGHQTWNEVIHRLEAGFDNSAESLTLSPALMNKYLARLVKLSSIWC